MSKKVVLVTGCSTGGIGYALCEEFAARGCKVYATSRNVKKVAAFKDETIERLALDVTSDDDVQRVVQYIHLAEGKLDVVVNNAGGICVGALLDIPLERVRQTFETNVFAALRVAKAVMPAMAERKSGTIVNIGSIVGEIPTPWNGIYSASKSALHTLTEVLSMEAKPFNVNVMLVSPGAVKSNIANNSAASFQMPEDSLYKDFVKNIYYRMNVSQAGNSMPTEKFVAKVVSNALQPKPPGSLFGLPSEMSRYPDYLSPNPTPTKLTKSQKSRARREPSGVFSLFQAPQIQQFKEAFQLIDHDKDGWVNEGDLKEIFASLGISPSKQMMDELLSSRPGKYSGSPSYTDDSSSSERGINFTMFLTMMSERLFDFDTEAQLIHAFESFDENDSGMVKVDEMRKWLGEIGERMDQREIDRFLKGPFTDRQGNFNYREWVKVLRVNGDEEQNEAQAQSA
ncbi:hypothetical protein EYR36_007649 [Pleurotus pulmonarius]|nr:hypothetical protein EYR36_007649 [Pleurotus pulmonarius]